MKLNILAPLVVLSAGFADVSVSNAPDVLAGQVRPTDGDSLRMGDKRIRLFGIDAPESAQRCELNGEEWACGRASRKALERMTKGKIIVCKVMDMDRDRYVSICEADGIEINAQMVRRGWAVAYKAIPFGMSQTSGRRAVTASPCGEVSSNARTTTAPDCGVNKAAPSPRTRKTRRQTIARSKATSPAQV